MTYHHQRRSPARRQTNALNDDMLRVLRNEVATLEGLHAAALKRAINAEQRAMLSSDEVRALRETIAELRTDAALRMRADEMTTEILRSAA